MGSGTIGCVGCQVTSPDSRNTCSAGHRAIHTLGSCEAQTLLIRIYLQVCAHKPSGGLDPEPSGESSKLWIKPFSSVKTGQRHINPIVGSGPDSWFILQQTGGQLPKYEHCQLTEGLFYTQYNMSRGRYLPVQGRCQEKAA